MKEITALFVLTFVSLACYAQTFTDYYDPAPGRPGYSYNVSVNLKFIDEDKYGKNYNVEVAVVLDNKGWYEHVKDRLIPCSELNGLCNEKAYDAIAVNVLYECNGKEVREGFIYGESKSIHLSFLNTSNGSCKDIHPKGIDVEYVRMSQSYKDKVDALAGGSAVAPGTPDVSSSPGAAVGANVQGASSTDIPTQGASSSTSTSGPSLTQKEQDEQFMRQQKANRAAYDAAIANPGTDKLTQDVQNLTTIVNTAAPLIDEWAEERERKRVAEEKFKRERAEKNRKLAEEWTKRAAVRFDHVLKEHLPEAENGDEGSQVYLIFSMLKNRTPGTEALLPKWKDWALMAAGNNNPEVMNLIGYNQIYSTNEFKGSVEDGVKLLENSAALGSLDAMIILGYYYDKKKRYGGGQDREKGLIWFTKGAENGCPEAMYQLAMIHLYKQIWGPGNRYDAVKYRVKRNNKIAFDLLSKSLADIKFKGTLFHKEGQGKYADPNELYSNSTYFNGVIKQGCGFLSYSFRELAGMYRDGKGCTKSKAMADELYNAYKEWDSFYK